MKFLRNLLAVLAGLFIYSLILFFMMLGIISASSTKRTVKIEDNSVLHLDLDGIITERENEDPLSQLNFPGTGFKEMGLLEMKEAINHAITDDKIRGIYLESKYFSAGFATLEELRSVLKKFRDSGKFIVAFSEAYTEKGYYLSSVANEIYLVPDYGYLEFNGLNVELMFLKGTLDKLGIEPQIFRVGEYKSAVEPFIRKDMSEANREQITSFINAIYNEVLTEVSESRELSYEEVKHISDSMLVRNGDDAVKYRLITKLAYSDEVEKILKDKMSVSEDDELNLVSYRKYNNSYSGSEYSSDRVAVIIGKGTIVPGEGDERTIGSEKYIDLVRDARTNDRVKAIVIRINSGGGSALASDVIWNEIHKAAQTKPVIASMSDVAASGGYFLAMGCDSILASPTTITGSIGIFGMIFNTERLMEDKLGITFDNVNTGRFSNLYTMTRPLTVYEKQIIQQSIDEGYHAFTTKAAESRNMPLEDLLKIASGRVWSGAEAKKIGLIDGFGSLEDAVKMAADAAGIEKFRVVYYPEQKTLLEEIMSDLSSDMQTRVLKMQLKDLYHYYQEIKQLENCQGIQARMPFDFNIY